MNSSVSISKPCLEHHKILYVGMAEHAKTESTSYLLKFVTGRSTSVMLKELSDDDAFTVTNQSDKTAMIGVMGEFEARVTSRTALQ